MSKKWDAKCDTRFQYLWLRNGIFYHRIELPRVDGKRRYKRISLHTGNFYEAREKIKNMNSSNNWPFDELRDLFNGLIFETDKIDTESFGMLSEFQVQKKLSKRNKKDNINQLVLLNAVVETDLKTSLNPEDRKLLENISEMMPMFLNFLETVPKSIIKASAPSRTISEVLETMLLKGNNCPSEQVRKRNTIAKLLAVANLKVEDDYSKFHDTAVIGTISRHIVAQSDFKGDMKRKLIRYIKELATCGTNIDPDNYKSNVILNLPKVEKTKKAEKNPHLPYTETQLLEIFNPKHTHFKENPDAFFACLIALFTGARANSAITLQYDDIIDKEGIPCIQFIENHPLKQLKNEASERIVPIHPHLLEVVFVDYVRRNQEVLKAKGTDFIFPRCITRGGKWNNKYTVRYVLAFFKSIGVKTGSNDRLDFHSFRKNASITLQNAGVVQSYINDIIGWEGKNTMEQSYSNHTLVQIKAEMDKFNYDFLKPHLAKWKKIFAQK